MAAERYEDTRKERNQAPRKKCEEARLEKSDEGEFTKRVKVGGIKDDWM